MADLKYYDVILAPVITEKSMNAMQIRNTHSTYTQMLLRLRLKKQLKECLKEQRLLRLTQ